MHFKKLELSNFRCFSTAKFEFPKLTIFTGKNSSGKSTAINALLSTLQGSGDNKYPVCLPANGNFCSLGGYKLLVHKGRISRNVSIGLELGFGAFGDKKSDSGTISISSTFNAGGTNDAACLKFLNVATPLGKLNISKDKEYTARFVAEKTRSAESEKIFKEVFNFLEKSFTSGERSKRSHMKRPNMSQEVSVRSKRIGDWDDLEKLFADQLHAKSFINSIRERMDSTRSWTRFIGPSRIYPNRFYYDRAGGRIGARGENLATQLFKWSENDKKRMDLLTKYLRETDLATSIDMQHTKDNVFQLFLGIKGAATATSLEDVGFGLSQVLPILAMDVSLGVGGTLITSQPELHLHPSAQARLADYFVKRTKDLKRQYIIETHSEYLINRLRLAVVKGAIRQEDVNIYHLELKNGASDITRIRIDRSGRIIGAPKDFFDTYRLDAFKIALSI